MNTKQINTVILGIMTLILSFLYPPYIHSFSKEEMVFRRDLYTEYKTGYNFLFTLGENDAINTTVLYNEFAIIVVIVLGFILVFRNKKVHQ